jgi:predicted dehydrogenase
MEKLRWGVLGVANIATEQVIPAMQQSEYSSIMAIASRDQAKADNAARTLGIPTAYGSYQALLSDSEIDAVYIPLPNHLHVPWSIKALEAGKHVLCEKPIALTTVEAEALLAASRQRPNLKIMEAFMYRHHPQWLRARDMVAKGAIGTLKTIHSFFSFYEDDPKSIVNSAEMGGGGLMDIGCYSISLARLLFAAEPQRVRSFIEYDAATKTDSLCSGILDFGVGTSTFTCSTQLTPYQRVQIFGTEGFIEIEIPFNAPTDRPCKLWHTRGEAACEAISVETCNQYGIQGDLFSTAVMQNTAVPTPLEDAVSNMRVIEWLKQEAK